MEETERVELDLVQKAVKDLDCKMRLVLVSMWADQIGMMDHLWVSIVKLGSTIEAVHFRLWRVEEDISDTSDLLDNHNIGNLSEGVARALVHLSPGVPSIPELEEITTKITDLVEMITAVDEDHQKAGRYLLSKLTSHPPVAPVVAAMGPRGAGQLNLLMKIVNDAGDQVRTLGQLLKRLEMATVENSRLKTQVESLSAETFSQGGIVLDDLGFMSEAQVRDFVLQECPKGDVFEVFLDAILLFCCDPVYKPAPGWEKQTRTMDNGYSTTVRKVISLYYEPHCAWYMGGKKVISGELLRAFKTSDAWKGVSDMDGRCQEVETSAATSTEIGRQWVADKLPSNRNLVPLALKMWNGFIPSTNTWTWSSSGSLNSTLLTRKFSSSYQRR
jgi:hypothetical protein